MSRVYILKTTLDWCVPTARINRSCLKTFSKCQFKHPLSLNSLSQVRALSVVSLPSNSLQCLQRSVKHVSGASQNGYTWLQPFDTLHHITPRPYSTEPNQTDNSHFDKDPSTSSMESESSKFELIYTAPLKGAIRTVKVFSLSTATAAVLGGPVLVWLGNPSVPLSGRIIMSSLVMLVGISTTALLHWLVKGYVIRMYYNEETKMVQLYTLSVFGRKKLHEFNISEARPPSATAFSSFQARGKSYFVHAEVFKDKKILSGLLGVYADMERSDM